MTAVQLIDSLGWTLLHFLWQGLLIAAVTAVALRVLRKANPIYRYNLACSALLACLLWPAAELTMRLGGGAAHAPVSIADAFLMRGAGGASGGLLAYLQQHLLWIVGFWALCAGALALRMALGLVWVRRAARVQVSDARLQASVSRLALQFGIGRSVRLRVVDNLSSPLTAGWLRPLVLVPASLVSGMPHELLEALLAHEMAHVKRLDYLVNLGQNVVEILLFYHPAVWWISGRIRAERELIADDIAARHTGAPRTLALALSELEKLQFSRHHLAVAANGGDLVSRVRRLVRPDPQMLNWKAAIPIFGLAAACLSLYVHAAAGPVIGTRAAQQADPEPAAALAAGEDSQDRYIRLAAEHAQARGIGDRAAAAPADAGVRPPTVIFSSCAKPNYPAADLAASHEGTVTLGFDIDAGGRILSSTVTKSSGYPSMDAAALDAIKLCTFEPAMLNDKPVPAPMKIQYVWTLK